MLLPELDLTEAQIVAIKGFLEGYRVFDSGWRRSTPLDAQQRQITALEYQPKL
jgi:hypothetical protein